MAGSCILRRLKEEDLEEIHTLIRQDALTDLEIAKRAEKLLGRAVAPTDHARAAVVTRYRRSRAYRDWEILKQNAEIELGKHIREVRERYDIVSKLVRTSDSDGFEGVSKAIQARLLTLAVEANDETLKAASGAKGWVATTMRLARELMTDRWRQQVEDLKKALQEMSEGKKTKTSVNMTDVVAKVDEIMGLK